MGAPTERAFSKAELARPSFNRTAALSFHAFAFLRNVTSFGLEALIARCKASSLLVVADARVFLTAILPSRI